MRSHPEDDRNGPRALEPRVVTPDDFWRRHPRLLLLSVIVLACVATILLLSTSRGPVVLYQRF
jgi:hypothetical protein